VISAHDVRRIALVVANKKQCAAVFTLAYLLRKSQVSALTKTPSVNGTATPS
jgi:hypothetical protein